MARRSKVAVCDCANTQQDKLHGPGKRVHNLTAKDLWRCTVCSKEKTGGGGGDDGKKAKKK